MMMEFSPAEPVDCAGGTSATGYMWPAYYWSLFGLNSAFTLVFICECVIKLLGFGVCRYFRDGWNAFDFLVVVVATVELTFEVLSWLNVFDSNIPGLSALRALRVLRMLKMLKSIDSIRKTVSTLLRSFASVVYLLLLLMLFIVRPAHRHGAAPAPTPA